MGGGWLQEPPLTSALILGVSCRTRPDHITQHRLGTEQVPMNVWEMKDQVKVSG